MATLSQRAQNFLASLRRDDPVPVEDVVKLLAEQGVRPIPAWIEFHERYAGYWEDLGSDDFAVWGLAHRQVQGVASTPNAVYVDKKSDGSPLTIMCADVHPSWDYLLRVDGEYIGPPFGCENFDVKVERNALMWEFTHAGPVERIWDINGVRVEDCRAQLVAEVKDFLVPEATDKFARYYCSPDKLMLESLKNAAIKLVVRKK